MSNFPSKLKKNWSMLSKRQKRNKWIALNWKIKQEVLLGRHGLYWTHEYEPETKDLHRLSNQWSDIYFPDPDGYTIWNMTLITLRQALWDKAKEIAEERIEAKMTQEEQEVECQSFASLFSFEKIPGSKLYRFRGDLENPKHASLMGKTKSEAVEEETQLILENEKLRIEESWALDTNYRFGIGVHAIVATSQLTPVSIAAFLGRFIQNKPWKDPVPEDWYPKSSEKKEHDLENQSVFILQSRSLKI